MGLVTEYHDTFSESDDIQNCFFSASCLEECAKTFKSLHPNIERVTLWSVLFKEGDMGLVTEYHDTFSESDDIQNCFFSASCLEECAKNFKSLHPNIESVTLWSDNGPHYKN